MEARRKLPVNRPALLPLRIPARFEQREEYERAKQWRTRFASDLAPFFDRWRPVSADPVKLIDQLTIPYVPRWTFGEDLSALQEPAGTAGTRTTGQAVSFALETIAALLAQGFAKVDLLVSSRDEYVHAARASIQGRQAASLKSPKVFCSYPSGELPVIDGFATRCRPPGSSLSRSRNWKSARMCRRQPRRPLKGPTPMSSSRVQPIPNGRLSRSRRSCVRPCAPTRGSRSSRWSFPAAKKTFYSSRLADFQALKLDPAQGLAAQQLSPIIERLKPLLEGKTELFAA
jgi:hypothetical protein